jgi:hypothetical protein
MAIFVQLAFVCFIQSLFSPHSDYPKELTFAHYPLVGFIFRIVRSLLFFPSYIIVRTTGLIRKFSA